MKWGVLIIVIGLFFFVGTTDATFIYIDIGPSSFKDDQGNTHQVSWTTSAYKNNNKIENMDIIRREWNNKNGFKPSRYSLPAPTKTKTTIRCNDRIIRTGYTQKIIKHYKSYNEINYFITWYLNPVDFYFSSFQKYLKNPKYIIKRQYV